MLAFLLSSLSTFCDAVFSKPLEVMREEFSLSHGLFLFMLSLFRLLTRSCSSKIPKMSSEKILLPFIVLYWQPINFSENILIRKSGEGLWTEAGWGRGCGSRSQAGIDA